MFEHLFGPPRRAVEYVRVDPTARQYVPSPLKSSDRDHHWAVTSQLRRVGDLGGVVRIQGSDLRLAADVIDAYDVMLGAIGSALFDILPTLPDGALLHGKTKAELVQSIREAALKAYPDKIADLDEELKRVEKRWRQACAADDLPVVRYEFPQSVKDLLAANPTKGEG